MVPRQEPAARRPAAVANESEKDGRAPEPAERIAQAGRGGDRKARHCRARPPTRAMAQEKAKAAARPGRQRQPAQHGEVARALAHEFADDGSDRPAAQRLLHRPGAVALAGDAQADHARQRQAEASKPRPVEAAALVLCRLRLDPQRVAAVLPHRADQEREGEGGTGAEVERRGGRNLVQRAAREPAAERMVKRWNAESERPAFFGTPGTARTPRTLGMHRAASAAGTPGTCRAIALDVTRP